MTRGRTTEGFALALLAAALWGFTPVGTKATLEGYSPEVVSVARLGVSVWLFRRLGGPGTSLLPRDPWSWVAGLALGVDFVLYNYGLRLTRASLAGLVVNVEVVSGIVLARVLLGESLTARRLAGGAVTLAGATIVTVQGVSLGDVLAPAARLGNAVVMLAALAWSLYAVAQRKAPPAASPFRLMTPIFVVALVTTLPLLLRPSAWHDTCGTYPTAMLAVLTLACTAGVYLVYARSQECLDLAVLSIVLAVIPVFAVGFAWLLLGEPVTPRVLGGGALVLAGVLLVATEP
jgi:drug/metabolite transporter (DMT)-like permease